MPIGCLSILGLIIDDLYKSVVGIPKENLHILDCGIGMGQYGSAIRQWIDHGYAPNFKTYIMGIEGFSAYRNPAWQLYNFVHVMTIQEWLKWEVSLKDRFDCILLLDVLEHFDAEEGSDILNQLKARLKPGGVFYVATPGIMNEQGAAYGNVLETHKYQWSGAELIVRDFDIMQDGTEPDGLGNYMLVAKHVNNEYNKKRRKKWKLH